MFHKNNVHALALRPPCTRFIRLATTYSSCYFDVFVPLMSKQDSKLPGRFTQQLDRESLLFDFVFVRQRKIAQTQKRVKGIILLLHFL